MYGIEDPPCTSPLLFWQLDPYNIIMQTGRQVFHMYVVSYLELFLLGLHFAS